MTLAYIAGIFDGEGCVGFVRCRKTIFPRILVTNTNLDLLKDLQGQFGGDIKPLAARRAHWKQGWSWRLSWSAAVAFLDVISPWLRVKRQQAQTVFAWDAIRLGRGRWRCRNQRHDEHAEAVRLLIERLRWLNAKGPTFGPDPIDALTFQD